jgi:hypothetical protein
MATTFVNMVTPMFLPGNCCTSNFTCVSNYFFLLSPDEPDGVGCSKHSDDDFQQFVLSEEVQDW